MIYKIFLFLSLAFCQNFPEVGNINSLDIATWNIENFPKRNSTSEYVHDIVEASNLDVIALQEISNYSDFFDLVDNLDNWIGFRYSDSDYGELAYLVNLENITIVQSPFSILNQYDHYFAYRPPYVIRIDYKGNEIIIINVHFKCCGDGNLENDYWDEEYRRQQASSLLKQYIDLNYNDKRVIILGDMNDDIADDPINNVFSYFINDAQNYFFSDTYIAEGPSDDWSFPNWPSHLDHILLTDEIFIMDSFSTDYTFTYKIDDYMNGWQQYDYYVSDHRPVIASFSFIALGDINSDYDINILDITILIGYILENIYYDNADINEDNGLNILDVIQLVDLIINQ